LIYHYNLGWPPGADIVAAVSGKRVVKFHNVTPPHFFEGLSPEYSALCRLGRKQIETLAGLDCDLYLSDSDYNQEELLEAGVPASRCRVVPPFHQVDRLAALAADPDILGACRDGTCNLVSVGRLVPNKGHGTLIDAFALYHMRHDSNSRMLIIGREDDRLIAYADGLRRRVSDWGLDQAVIFTDEVTDSALKAYYLSADLYLTASAHEGFCVPLVEAMALELPIVAYGSTAIPATVGDAGLVWENPDPELFAESIHALARNDRLRQALARRGRRRYEQHFSTARIKEQFSGALGISGRP